MSADDAPDPTADAASGDAAPAEPAPGPADPAPAAVPAPAAPPPETAAAPDVRTQAQLALGHVLFVVGGLLLPLGLGIGLGYWAGDRGVAWVPTLVGWLLVLWILALILLIAGSYLLGPAAGRPQGRKRIIAFVLLIVAAAGARGVVYWMAEPSPLTAVSARDFAVSFHEDAQRVRALDRGLAATATLLEAQEGLFPADAGDARVPTADEEALVLDAWAGYVDSALALDQVRAFYEDYFRFDLGRAERDRHVRSFLLTFAAELSLYENTHRLLDLLERNPNVVKFLEVAHPERGLPEGTVSAVREELAGLTDLSRVLAGKEYLGWLDAVHEAEAESAARGDRWLWDEVERLLALVAERRKRDLGEEAVKSDLAPLKRQIKGLVFPVQKGVADWMGDTKLRRAGRYLITEAQLEAAAEDLAPGDVMLGRKNWYLSNVGLPGFWPHAMLYVGTPDELAAAFDADPETLDWVEAQCGERIPFTAYLERTYPDRWADRVGSVAAGEPLVVIEAVGEGVLQTTLVEASGDYLAAMRPSLSPWVKAQAIARAFGYVGRSYDFEFDFATDDKLVCTELVWRSYRPLGDAPGIEVEPVTVVGRKTYPANELARVYAEEHGTDDPQLEFVLFLEAKESLGKAVVADEAAFRATPDRSKWDLAQE